MRIGISHKAVAHLATAIADDATMIAVHPTEYEPILSAAPGDFVYLLIRGPANRELVKVTVDWAAWGGYLTIARGQGGTTARAWPAGSMLFATTHADHFNSIIQSGARTIDYNPNSILAPLFAGEKVYQSTAGYQRWWKAFNGSDQYWDIITGAIGANEAYTDIGWNYPIIITSGPSWDVHFDNNDWEPRLGIFASWNAGGWWDSFLNVYHRIELAELGTWVEGYQPTKFRVSIDEPHTNCKITLVTGSTQRLVQDWGGLTDGQEFDIPSAWYSTGNIRDIWFWRSSGEGNWQLENLEWLV